MTSKHYKCYLVTYVGLVSQALYGARDVPSEDVRDRISALIDGLKSARHRYAQAGKSLQ